MALKSYRHVPLTGARQVATASRRLRFRVTTINWSYATERGISRRDKVHRNVYEWTLPYLIRWIRDTADVVEDIVQIEPIVSGGEHGPAYARKSTDERSA